MSQNTFGQAQPQGQPSQPPLPVSADEGGTSHRKLLIGGAAGLAAIVLLGAAALVVTTGGGEDDLTAAPVSPRPAVTASSVATEPPVPLPTLAEFNGRNPFKAKIVEGTGGAAGGTAAGATGGTSTAPTSGTTGSSTGGLVIGTGGSVISLPGKPGPAGAAGPAGTPGAPGAAGQPGEDGEDASALYGVLVSVEKLEDGTLVGHFALGLGADFELYKGKAVNPDTAPVELGKLTTDPDGAEATAPATWVEVLELVEDPTPEDDSKDASAVIRFGDDIRELKQWEAVALF